MRTGPEYGSIPGLRYTWGLAPDDLLAIRDAGGNHYYVTQDRLRSVRGLVQRSDGSWLRSLRYGPYGAVVKDTAAPGAPSWELRYRWTGRDYDAETGFYFHRSRYYDPGARRFVQEDKIGYAGGPNLYAYLSGRPLAQRDPFGFAGECGWVIIGWVSTQLNSPLNINPVYEWRDCGPADAAGGGLSSGASFGPGSIGAGSAYAWSSVLPVATQQAPLPQTRHGVCSVSTLADPITVDASIAPDAREFIYWAVTLGARDLAVTSSFRTTSRQIDLWLDRYVFEKQTRYPVAFPGESLHEAGFSLDLNWDALDARGRTAVLTAAAMFGFQQLRTDRIHFQWGRGFGPYEDKYAAIAANQAGSRQGVRSCGI